jgi:hypothetical protein
MAEPNPQQAIRQIRQDVVESSAAVLFGFGTLMFGFAVVRNLLLDAPLAFSHYLDYGLSVAAFLLRRHMSVEWQALVLLSLFAGAATVAMTPMACRPVGRAAAGMIFLATTIFGANGALAASVSVTMLMVRCRAALDWLRSITTSPAASPIRWPGCRPPPPSGADPGDPLADRPAHRAHGVALA